MSKKSETPTDAYRKIYQTFVVTVIGLILLTQAITQYFIYTQKYDANRINIAGRQRMLSQRITKTILKIYLQKDNVVSSDFSELRELKELFFKSHRAVLDGNEEFQIKANNSELASSLFAKLEPNIVFIFSTVDKILEQKKIEDAEIQILFLNESEFLKTMDQIVSAYSEESITRTTRLQLLESVLAMIAVIVILVEIAILYRPLIQKLAEDNIELAEQKKHIEDFSFLLSHKVRKHIANLLGLMNTINPNNLLEIKEYFQYVKQSVMELDSVSQEFSGKTSKLDSQYSLYAVDSTQKYETFEKLRTIMLIDDDKITNILTKKILLKFNPEIKVEVFSDPIKSIEYLEKLKSDNWEYPVIFLDINMPQMTGWQFLEQIANLNMNPTVYILTSSIDKNDITKARTYKNVKAFLTKPLTQDKMPTFV
ncbi:MAG: response regulator [Leptospiraceae bacterium]|nr:response regulator [Leptospiraceae bacterium]